MRNVWFVVLGLTLFGCAAEVSDVGGAPAPITGGTLETGRPEVVLMYRTDGAACTGTIISPRVVLTANHCVESRTSSGPAPASAFRIYVGSSDRALTAEYRVSEVRPVPDAGLGGRQPNDVALLVLSTPARETPMELAREVPTSLFSHSPITAVGYGQTPSGSSGTKYTTTTRVAGYDSGFIFVPPSVCSGDSGGPLIGESGRVWGVASFIYSPDGMSQPQCGTAPGAYNEIYRHVAFIDSVLEETGSCLASPDTPEICNGLDDNCDERVDETCTPIGEACVAGSECVGGICADTVAGRICTSECDPLRPEQGCGIGFYCGNSSGCAGHCVPGEPGTGAYGQECTVDTECASLRCVNPGDGRRRCLDPCRADSGLCLAGEVCAASPGTCGSCVDAEILLAPHGLGEPCEEDTDCRDAMVCHEAGGVRACARACESEEDCGEGFECREMLCIPDRRHGIGGVCLESADCGEGGTCAAMGDDRWCTTVCASAADCPTAFDCVPAGGTMVCAPSVGLEGAECVSNADCVTGLCATSASGSFCTSYCDAATRCAPGLECIRTGSASSVCAPIATPTSGGCAVTASPGASALPSYAFLLALVVFGLRRRRGA